jgi:hypothetical protein
VWQQTASSALLDGSEGFDLSRGTWRKSGWKELKDLRKVRVDIMNSQS